MNKNLRVGIQTGALYGVVMAVLAGSQHGRLLLALIGAILFGAMMAWFSWRGERRLKAKGIDAPNLNPVQVRSVDYSGPPHEALEATRQALQMLRTVKKVTETQVPLSLRVRTSFTFESFGENIAIGFAPSATGTSIEISSKPRISTTLMDMGRGVENVETIVRYLLEGGAARRVA